MPYFWKQPPEPLGRYDDRGFCYECSEMAPCDCEPEPRIPLRLRFKQWRGRTAWKLDRLGRQLAFWQFPARIERLSIRLAIVEDQNRQLGQTLGGLVAEKRKAREDELEGGYLTAMVPGRQGYEERVDAMLVPEENAAGIVRTVEPPHGA
jgi:hypothetical protein